MGNKKHGKAEKQNDCLEDRKMSMTNDFMCIRFLLSQTNRDAVDNTLQKTL